MHNYHLVARCCLYAASMYAVGLSNSIADWRALRAGMNEAPMLPDLAFDALPHVPELALAPDACMRLVWLVLAGCIFREREWRALTITFFDAQSQLLVLRAITVPLTSLPSPVAPCVDKLPRDWLPFLADPAIRMLSADGLMSWCHDLVFSGHTAHLMLVALFVHSIARTRAAVRVGTYVLVGVGIGALLLARLHYTLDVVLALFATTAVFSRYHGDVPSPDPWPQAACAYSLF